MTKIVVTGETGIDEITVNGGQQSRVVDVTAGLVWSVNGKTGTVSGLAETADIEPIATAAVAAHVAASDPHGDRAAAASDATSKVAAHTAATDPHGDRAYAASLIPVDWINVAKAPYNAAGNGTTDDKAAIQAALNAAPAGGVVYLPAKIHAISGPLRVPPTVSLLGPQGGTEVQPGAPAPVAAIKLLPSFTGNAAIQIVDQQIGGYSTLALHQRIEHISIDGSAVPSGTAVDGIRMTGQIQGPIIRDVAIRSMTGGGINTDYNASAPPGPQAPFCVRLDRVTIMWPAGVGVSLNNSTDSTLNDVYVLGGNSFGWWVSGAGNSTLIACRSEWCGLDGFRLTVGNGNLRMIGCSSDRNNGHGVSVSGDAGSALLMTGCTLTRDGRNSGGGGGNKAGLNVEGANCRVIADGLVVQTGADDDGATGPQSPQYGVRALTSAYLAVNSGSIGGVTAAVSDGGGNTALLRGAGLSETTGPSTAVVAADRFLIDMTGAHKWSTDTTLARTAANTLGLTGANLHVASVGRGLRIAEGTNAKSGTAVLNGTNAVAVANTSVTANSRIQLTIQTPGGTVGSPYVSARTAGTSFQIKSTATGDTSTVAYLIVEP